MRRLWRIDKQDPEASEQLSKLENAVQSVRVQRQRLFSLSCSLTQRNRGSHKNDIPLAKNLLSASSDSMASLIFACSSPSLLIFQFFQHVFESACLDWAQADVVIGEPLVIKSIKRSTGRICKFFLKTFVQNTSQHQQYLDLRNANCSI
ncbi:hypothetical protein L596_017514 [Steinernema carpocapsae]|uniref:Uncharacterized protein n=1 Tax=Steinernema carpocapsae TaxID=34508 RepID=A0A4U5N272_STECR|nr:hypothetical protein L596_017514 [Steinernema carpocapsae]